MHSKDNKFIHTFFSFMLPLTSHTHGILAPALFWYITPKEGGRERSNLLALGPKCDPDATDEVILLTKLGFY